MRLQAGHPIQGQFFHLLKCNKVHLIRSLPLCSGEGRVYATWYEHLYVWENVCEMA